MTTPSLRCAVRGLVIDSNERVLLVRLVFPQGSWWVLPGGGIAKGETDIDALTRELVEEVGLVNPNIGSLVWNRVHIFDLTDSDGIQWPGQQEAVYLVRTEPFLPMPFMTPGELIAENIGEIRWWTVDEIINYRGPDHLSPTDVGLYVESILCNGIPDIAFEITNDAL